MMIVVYVVMNDLAEMVTYLPLKGISIPYFVNRFVEPSLAFADGWNYWYAYAILVAAESTAGAIVIQYWTSTVPVGAWIAIILAVILILNIIAVAFFGEAEFCELCCLSHLTGLHRWLTSMPRHARVRKHQAANDYWSHHREHCHLFRRRARRRSTRLSILEGREKLVSLRSVSGKWFNRKFPRLLDCVREGWLCLHHLSRTRKLTLLCTASDVY